jgi:uridine kinase
MNEKDEKYKNEIMIIVNYNHYNYYYNDYNYYNLMMSPYITIIFVGFPGMGKTSVARHLIKAIPGMVHIEQDQFYHSGNKCDVNAYLQAVENAVQSNHVVLGKNHHDRKSLGEVLDVLRGNQVNYFIYNFIPSGFRELTKDEQEPLIVESSLCIKYKIKLIYGLYVYI